MTKRRIVKKRNIKKEKPKRNTTFHPSPSTECISVSRGRR